MATCPDCGEDHPQFQVEHVELDDERADGWQDISAACAAYGTTLRMAIFEPTEGEIVITGTGGTTEQARLLAQLLAALYLTADMPMDAAVTMAAAKRFKQNMTRRRAQLN